MLQIGLKPGAGRNSLAAAVQKSLVAGLLSCLLAAPLFSRAQAPAPGLVVFGDSLSDSGNSFVLKRLTTIDPTQLNNVPPNYVVDMVLVPDAPYAVGGHHLSNGATWVEDLAQSLGLAPNTAPALRGSGARATNYAVAGARAYNDGKNFNLSDQVSRFLADFGGSAPKDALYVIEIGGSDVRDALALQNPGIAEQGLASIYANVATLYQAGARKFLLMNVPNIGLIPSVRMLEQLLPFAGLSGIGGVADRATVAFNAGLLGIATMLGSFPDIQIRQFSLYDSINKLYNDPAAYGLTEVIAPCITPNVAPFKCTNPDEYLFWDGIHPTKTVHAIVAQQVAQFLAQ